MLMKPQGPGPITCGVSSSAAAPSLPHPPCAPPRPIVPYHGGGTEEEHEQAEVQRVAHEAVVHVEHQAGAAVGVLVGASEGLAVQVDFGGASKSITNKREGV